MTLRSHLVAHAISAHPYRAAIGVSALGMRGLVGIDRSLQHLPQ